MLKLPNWLARSLTAFILVPLIALILFVLPAQWYCLLVAGAALLGLNELFALLRRQGYKPLALPGMVFGAAILLKSCELGPFYSMTTQGIMAFFAIFLLVAQFLRAPRKGYLGDLAATYFGVFYVAGLMAFAARLRFVPDGLSWVFLMLTATWLFDTLAYAWGSAAGRYKLWPAVSPKKTWEGFWGGALSTMLLFWVLGRLPDVIRGFPMLLPGISPLVLAALVFLNCVVAQTGDLAESMIKRAAGAKDSSLILPGHGGMLDKLDSFIFSGPFIYLASLLL